MRWKKRVVVVFADSEADPMLERQRETMRELLGGADDRDLHLIAVVGDRVEGAGDDAAALRRRFGAAAGFHAVLIGKDGGRKLSQTAPLTARQLTETIDAMPMRRGEIRR